MGEVEEWGVGRVGRVAMVGRAAREARVAPEEEIDERGNLGVCGLISVDFGDSSRGREVIDVREAPSGGGGTTDVSVTLGWDITL